MHEERGKSERILVWKTRVISGVGFTLTSILMHMQIHLNDPETYEFFELYMSSITYLSSAIIGGCFGPIILRTASKEKYLVGLLKNVFFFLICETILVAFLSALLSLYFRGDIIFSLLFFVLSIPVFSLIYGTWRIAQIIITISILFLWFRYIKARESRE